MAKVLHVQGHLRREGDQPVTPELADRLLRKIVTLAKRLGCTFHADWRIGDPPEAEDAKG